ncbi:hypothetical protein WCN79_03065 [Xanthomonas axonopodis pv. vasculorum]|uniref:Uncharacterized protein n=1 Tax=Xanthomonas axonopodis pv. vasculorum TaxID=325777 RepID=A0A098Q3W0_9XANT|nr:hypothetical protein [Xanthomonas axonopodis]KGE53583.1 hypothetical protein GW15_0201290 [Xanthomonas axonopodis pv. vasculorum]PPV07911.1 hypothetical protein XavaCFBP5823_18305 [Xanthomonas axonopodis pv. vasculorum]QKD88639.1 hypothetical protein XAV_20155 [Xanthomonas axonopodis pv. vasculorum]
MAPELREHGTAEASTSNPMSHAGSMTAVPQEHSAVERCAGSQIVDMWLSSLERPARRSSGSPSQSTVQSRPQSKLEKLIEKRRSMLQRAIILDDQWRSLQERCAGRSVGGRQPSKLNILKGTMDRDKQALESIGDGGGYITDRRTDRRLDRIDRNLGNFEEKISNQKKLESHLAKAGDFLGRLKLLKSELSARGDNKEILENIDLNIKDLESILNELKGIDANGAGIEYNGCRGNAMAYFDSVTAALEAMLRSQDPGYHDYMRPALAVVLKDGYSPSRQKAVSGSGMHGGDTHGIS